MKEPRPAMISALPSEIRSRVANCWKTRTGSSLESTVTALVRRGWPRSRGGGADGIVAGETGDGALEAGMPGQRGGGREGDRGRVGDVLGSVVLPQAVHVKANLIGKGDLLDEVAHALLGA